MNKSFTLIEILVAIVVIGILSSFIIIGLSSVSDKANIAKSQVFSNSIRNSLLMNLVSEWKLDGNANDSWGTNNGTLVGPIHLPVLKTDSDCVSGSCYQFDGTEDHIYFGDILDIGTSDLTISIWAKISFLPFSGSEFLIGKSDASVTDGRYAIGIISTGKARAIFDPSLGVIVDSVKSVNIGWNFITAVWDRDNTMRIYLNSFYENQISISSGNGINFNTGLPFLIGSYTPTSYFFEGIIDNASFYFGALSNSQIQQSYYLGLNKLYKNNGITQIEYNQRITGLKFNLSQN